MNGSVVIAKIAGMLSTAKITSEISTSTSARKSGVIMRTPSRTTKKRSPSSFSVIG